MEKEAERAVKESIKTIKQNSSPVDPQHTNSSLPKIQNQFGSFPENFSAVKELNTFYIFVGLSAVIILIFILRAMRFRSKKSSRIRRYGVVTARGDVEMMPLDNEEDDEDATVFDITDHSGPKP